MSVVAIFKVINGLMSSIINGAGVALSKFVIYSAIELKIGSKFIIPAIMQTVYVMHVCP